MSTDRAGAASTRAATRATLAGTARTGARRPRAATRATLAGAEIPGGGGRPCLAGPPAGSGRAQRAAV